MAAVLAVAEHRDGELRDVTFEVLSAAADIADGSVEVLLVADEPDEMAEDLALEGIERVHTLVYDAPFNHDVYVQAITQLCDERSLERVIAPNTVNGLDYVPAVASTLDVPVITDAINLEQANGTLKATREAFGSKVETTLSLEGEGAVVSIRPGEWPAETASGDPTIAAAPVSIDEAAIRSSVNALEAVTGGDVDISEAEVLVSVGRGIGEEENLSLIEDLADTLGATISASRPIVDAGWLPKNRQVGQSGKTVTPDVYLAIGISGAVQHVAGMKGAETIIAINKDGDAPIFDIADIGIVDDLFEVVPALIDALEAE